MSSDARSANARVQPAELRRLNKLEYNNSLRDLMGVDLRPAISFPDDNSNYGFDNNANSLTSSGYLMELYLAAARQVVEAALASPQARAKLVPCDLRGVAGSTCAGKVLRDFARRAFRRPVTDDEHKGLLDLATQHADALNPDSGVAVAMRAVLVSPSFLFRVETEVADRTGKPVPVSDHELAVRLSYFLWSSIPDETLFALADRRQLQDPAVLEAQVRRMLADPRARALLDGFASQWLSLRLLDSVTPSSKLFPDFNDDLRSSMRTETELFFQSFLKESRDLNQLVSARDIFVDRRLAKYYGAGQIPDAPGFSRLTNVTGRGGLLRLGGWLTLTSKATRTSAVVRGEWVLSHLMCNQPPPPPPGVEGFPTDDATRGLTQSQVLAQHRNRPECAACHALMDPIGLGLENYDPVGRWRQKTADGVAIPAAGTMPDGRAFAGPDELVEIIAADPAIGRCVTQKLLTYALGRGPQTDDQTFVDVMEHQLANRPRTLTDVLVEISRSDLMRKRSLQTKEN